MNIPQIISSGNPGMAVRWSRRRFLTLAGHLAGGFAVTGLAGCLTGRRRETDCFECWFVDVGYGDAILLRSPDHAVFIDGGYPVCSHYIVRFLYHLGVESIQTLILTHPHPDHIGGFFGILSSGIESDRIVSAYPLDHPEIPEGFRQVVDRRRLKYQVVRRGDRIDSGPFHFTVLHPAGIGTDMNDSSLVLRLDDDTNPILLTADIGPGVQNELARIYGLNLRSVILKSPHHGGVSDEAFISMVSPRIAYVPVGINPYGNPDPGTLTAYAKTGIRIVVSSESGTMLAACCQGDPPRIYFPGIRWNPPGF